MLKTTLLSLGILLLSPLALAAGVGGQEGGALPHQGNSPVHPIHPFPIPGNALLYYSAGGTEYNRTNITISDDGEAYTTVPTSPTGPIQLKHLGTVSPEVLAVIKAKAASTSSELELNDQDPKDPRCMNSFTADYEVINAQGQNVLFSQYSECHLFAPDYSKDPSLEYLASFKTLLDGFAAAKRIGQITN